MKQKLTGGFAEDQMYLQIKDLKQGIDVLNAITSRQNISQYGRMEQQAAQQALWLIDSPFAAQLDNSDNPLTPKETFYMVMEHFGISDDEKLDLFCCSEQALRSTKSRLKKKLK